MREGAVGARLMAVRALERCAYCRRDVPVTWVDIPATNETVSLAATVAVCEACYLDGR